MAVHVHHTWGPWAGLKRWLRVFEIHACNLLHATTHTFITRLLCCSLQIISWSPFFPTSHPSPPLSHTKELISKHGSWVHRPVELDQHIWWRVNGAWCKGGDTAVCSRLNAKLPIQQSSKALKHVLQAHLKHTLFPPSPLSTHTHTH